MTDSVRDATSYLADTDDGYVQAKVGLIRKRAAIMGELETLNREVAQKTADLRAIEAALRVLEPGMEMDGLPSRRPTVPYAAFRGEPARLLLSALKNAPEGATTRELTSVVMRERHMNPDDPAEAKLMHRRVNHALHNLRNKGLARSGAADTSGMLRWLIEP